MSLVITNTIFGKGLRGNILNDSFIYDTIYDTSNNIYVCGLYRSNYARNIIPITNNISNSNGFIAKYDTSYNLLWINIISSTNNSQVNSIKFLNGFLYFGGTYISTALVTLSGGLTLPSTGSTTTTWSFISKCNTNGSIQFANTISGTVNATLNDIYVDTTNFYITGGYQSLNPVSLSGQTLPATLASRTSSYFAVYNEGGTCTLARDISDMVTATGIGFGITVNLSGIIVAGQEISGAGMSSYTKIFNSSTGVELVSRRIAVTTYSATSRIQHIKVCSTSTNIYVVGEYYGTTFTNTSLPTASNQSSFMIIYNNALTETYSRRIATTGSARNVLTYASDLYVVGFYNSVTSVDLSSGITVPASLANDGLIIRYDLSGVTQAALPIRSNSTGGASSLFTVARNNSRILIGGSYSNLTDVTLSGGILLRANGSTNVNSDYFVEYDTSLNIAYGTQSIYSVLNINDSANSVTQYNNIMYACGSYGKYLTIPSDISDSIPNSRNNFKNAYVIAYDSSGGMLWFRPLNATSDSTFFGITSNSSGIFVVGQYSSSSTIDLGNGQILPTSTSLDPVLIKYDFSGNAIWYSHLRDTGTGGISTSVSTINDDIFIAGRYASTGQVTISGSAVVLPSTSNLESGFIIKYNSAGIALWASTSVPKVNLAVIYDCITSSINNVFIGGRFRCTTTQNTLDLSNGVSVPASYLGFDRGFVAAFNNSNGNALWENFIDSSGASPMRSIGCNENNVFIGGGYNTRTATESAFLSPTIIFPPTNNATRPFIAKYDFLGNVVDGISLPTNGTMNNTYMLEQNVIYALGYNGGAFTIPRSSIVVPGSVGGVDCATIVYDLSFIPYAYTRVPEPSNDGNFFGVAASYTSMYAVGNYNSAIPVDLSNGITLPRTSVIDALYVKYDILTIPPTPINLTATPQIESILLNWTPSANATSYTVIYGISGSFTSSESFVTASGIILSLTPGISYNFRVSATNSLGTSFNSTIAYGIPLYPVPSTPTGFTGVGIVGGIDLSWNITASATSYVVYYGTTFGIYDSSAVFLTSPGQLTSLIPDTLYYLYIIGRNPSFDSAPSPYISVSVLQNPPDTPVMVSGTAISEGAIIQWTDASRATGYMLEYGISGSYTASLTTTGISGLVEGLLYNIPYNFRVRAYNSGGYSGYSSVVYVIPLAPIVGIPFIIEPTIIGRNEMTIISSIPKNVISYRITYSEINANFENIINSIDNTFELTYLKPSTQYKFIITAYGVDTQESSDIIYKTTLNIPITQTSTGNTDAGSIINRITNDTIYNYKQTYDNTTGRVWQFRSGQERIAYLQALTKNFTPK